MNEKFKRVAEDYVKKALPAKGILADDVMQEFFAENLALGFEAFLSADIKDLIRIQLDTQALLKLWDMLEKAVTDGEVAREKMKN